MVRQTGLELSDRNCKENLSLIHMESGVRALTERRYPEENPRLRDMSLSGQDSGQ